MVFSLMLMLAGLGTVALGVDQLLEAGNVAYVLAGVSVVAAGLGGVVCGGFGVRHRAFDAALLIATGAWAFGVGVILMFVRGGYAIATDQVPFPDTRPEAAFSAVFMTGLALMLIGWGIDDLCKPSRDRDVAAGVMAIVAGCLCVGLMAAVLLTAEF